MSFRIVQVEILKTPAVAEQLQINLSAENEGFDVLEFTKNRTQRSNITLLEVYSFEILQSRDGRQVLHAGAAAEDECAQLRQRDKG